jgi:hypothetical protein
MMLPTNGDHRQAKVGPASAQAFEQRSRANHIEITLMPSSEPHRRFRRWPHESSRGRQGRFASKVQNNWDTIFDIAAEQHRGKHAVTLWRKFSA